MHPIYKNKENNEVRKTILSLVDEAGVDEVVSAMCAKVEKEKQASIFGKDSLYRAILGQVRSFLIDRAIAENGHILIKVDKDEWSSPQSRKTMQKLDLNNFEFPFVAGSILFGDENELVCFCVEKSKDGTTTLSVYKDTEYGVLFVFTKGGLLLKDSLDNNNISRDNKDMIYDVVSILLYIATFKKKLIIKDGRRPKMKGSKRKSIPKHSVHNIVLNQTVIARQSSTKKEHNKSDKYWLVRGHWRNQYHPKSGVHKPKWIDPHFRGCGKDMVEKVYKIKENNNGR
ncbi:hypothetical protein MNB_SV-13-991 [hydrothermal vent metagenome]|uniref:Uncharacterized protein n=1 Tax=hydrothermal vent metagenome TaxID=652676 RepID=A0A1W1CIF5_9ZZZZ